MNDLDRKELIAYFNRRIDAEDEAMRAYWSGRIDGHCLQNAIDFADLSALAAREAFRIDWSSALLKVSDRSPARSFPGPEKATKSAALKR